MEILDKKIRVNVFKLIVLIIAIAITILCYFYFSSKKSDLDSKIESLISGLLAGLVVGLLQLLLSWYEHRSIQKFKSMLIFDVMSDRDNRPFYEKIIRSSKKRVYVMGVTADRFLEHFADIKGSQENAKVLIEAMASRNVRVRILLPLAVHLDTDRLQTSARLVQTSLQEVKERYPDQFEFKYFNHVPTHSIFIMDDACILGPVFPGVSSKDTPAIYLDTQSPFADKYLEYFEKEWNNAI